MTIKKRIAELEAKHKPEPELKLTANEINFINDLEQRRLDKGTNFYHEVCNDEEFDRIRNLSTKRCLIWYRENISQNGY